MRKKLFKVSPMFILGIFLNIISSLLNLVVPLQIRSTIDLKELITDNKNYGLLVNVVIFLICGAILNSLGGFIISREGDKQVYDIRMQVQSHILKLPVSFFNNNLSGSLSSRVVNDSNIVKNFMTLVIPSFISSCVTFIGTIFFLVFLDWKMTCLVLLGCPALLLIIVPLGKITERLSFQAQEKLSQLTGVTTETFQNIRSVKLNTAEDSMLSEFQTRVKQLYKVSIKMNIINSVVAPIQSLMIFGLMITIIMYGGVRVSSNTLSIGTLVSILMYFFQAMPAMNSIVNFYSNYKQAKGSTNQIAEILSMHTEIYVDKQNVPNNISNYGLELQNVSFSYSDNLVLQNIYMKFPNNKKIAIVGPSGVGKTTVINLLTRLYEPTGGMLLLGETNANEYDLKSWRNMFSVVTQENSIVSGSIKDNLVLGVDKKITNEMLEASLIEANLLEEVKLLDNGIDTVVGEQGVKLSGGQRQRLQIARAYLKDSKIIIFDEATSNLDANTEQIITKSMNKLIKTKAVIAVAHRLSTIIDSDYIYFIDQKTIIGSGTHEELMIKLPEYKEFVEKQMLHGK